MLTLKFLAVSLQVLWAAWWMNAAASELGGVVASGPGAAMLESVSGVVSVAGSYQRPKPLPVFKNRAFCGATVLNETLLVGAGGGLRNSVVLLRPMDRKVETHPRAVTLDNKNCAFMPHVQVATVGSDVLLKNSDPILHTVHARMGRETLFNVGLPRWRQVSKRLERPGVMRIDCDVLHTWMSAAIVIADTPYFAVSDERGRFEISAIPPGRYDMEVWHERLGSQSLHVVVAAQTSRFVEIIYAFK
jgi:hypothetical protein